MLHLSSEFTLLFKLTMLSVENRTLERLICISKQHLTENSSLEEKQPIKRGDSYNIQYYKKHKKNTWYLDSLGSNNIGQISLGHLRTFAWRSEAWSLKGFD